MVIGKASVLTVAAASMLAATVKGHGSMSVPKVEFTFNGDTTQYMATIEAADSGFSGQFNAAPKDNTDNFNKGIAASKYKSLKEFMMDKAKVTSPDFTLECGYTNPKETPQPLPETYVEWSHGSGEGFTASHEGPCEVWCDDTRVFQDDNCPANFPTAPAKLPYDREACLGASGLTIYWIALHSPSWQVYINCAALEKTTSTGAKSKFAVGGGGGGASTPATEGSTADQDTEGSTADQDTETPATPSAPTATEAPSTPSSPATEAPSAPSTPTTEAPAPTEAPATDSPVVTPAPNTGAEQTQDDTSKCTVRRRRRN